MKVASLFSGGEYSTYALWCAQMQGWDVEYLVTVFPEAKDSWMFHYPVNGLAFRQKQSASHKCMSRRRV